MELTNAQWELFDFVKIQHGNQKRKYTSEPYFFHLLAVVEILSKYSINNDNMEIEIALCHDLLERTACTKQDLALKLIELGYDMFPRNKILKGVYDLTNIYTEEIYPMYSRSERKQLEAERILEIEPFSQTVMYAKIITNTRSIVEHDPEFAKIYLNEIIVYLNDINEGNYTLFQVCYKEVQEGLERILIN